VGLGNDLSGDVEVLSEVGETLIGEGVVVPLPRELSLDESLRSEGLHGLDNLEVSDGHVGVLGSVEVLGSDEDTLLEEVLVDLYYQILSILPPMILLSILTVRRLALVMIILAVFNRFRESKCE
jgi:hypothetical protein